MIKMGYILFNLLVVLGVSVADPWKYAVRERHDSKNNIVLKGTLPCSTSQPSVPTTQAKSKAWEGNGCKRKAALGNLRKSLIGPSPSTGHRQDDKQSTSTAVAGKPQAGFETSVPTFGTFMERRKTRFMVQSMTQALVLRPRSTEREDTIGDTYAAKQLGSLVADIASSLPPEDIPAALRDTVRKAMRLANEEPELGFSMAASLCERWDRPPQTEYILSQVLTKCDQMAKGRGPEMVVATFRSFAQQLQGEELHRRAQLKIGRLYYDYNQYGKAVMELTVDPTLKTPSGYDTLAGLVKGVSLMRLGQTEKAFSTLEWVANNSPDTDQRARSALLIGRLKLVHRRQKEAYKWLQKVVQEIPNGVYSEEAKKLLKEAQN